MARYCPAGDGAFGDGVDRCPTCGRRLADRPPANEPTPETGDDPVVYLATVANEPLAQLCVQVLGEAGIRALAKASGPGFAAWGSVATFEHDLYVLRSQLAHAERVLAELNAADGNEAAGNLP